MSTAARAAEPAEDLGGPQDPAVLHTVGDATAALDGLRIVSAEQVRRSLQVDGQLRFAIDTPVRTTRT